MGERKAHSGMWSHQPCIEIIAAQLSSTFGRFLFYGSYFFSPGEVKSRERKPIGLSLQETNPPCRCSRPSHKMSVLRKQNEALALHPCKRGWAGGKELAFSYCFSSSK